MLKSKARKRSRGGDGPDDEDGPDDDDAAQSSSLKRCVANAFSGMLS
mgnify:FL=1